MSKVISAKDLNVKSNDVTTGEESNTTLAKFLIARHYSITSKVNLEFVYDDDTSKNISLSIGDEVSIKYVDDAGNLKLVEGVITDIRNANMADSFVANSNMGNGNYLLQLKIDASEEYGSNVLTLYLINIYDISPIEIDPGEEVVDFPIVLPDNAVTMENGKLNITYNTREAGSVLFTVYKGEGEVIYNSKSEIPMILSVDTNEEDNTEVKEVINKIDWDLRDYSSLNGTSIEGLEYDENGNYIYNIGDEDTFEEVAAIKNSNDTIVSPDTGVSLSLLFSDALNIKTRVTTAYKVTAEDVEAAKVTITPPEEETPVKCTVTVTVTNGTSNKEESYETDLGNSETIEFTPVSDEYTEITAIVNEQEVDAELIDGKVTIVIDEIIGDTTVSVLFDKKEENPEEGTETKDASWIEGSDIIVENGLMTIPYNRAVAGEVSLNISKESGEVVFREANTFSTANPNATFTWSMRDFSSLNGTSIEGLTYDEEGNYVYKNGDASITEVHNIDMNNDLIIPAGTVLNIVITRGNATLEKQYTVTEEDVVACTF